MAEALAQQGRCRHHPGRHAIQPCAPDGGRGGAARLCAATSCWRIAPAAPTPTTPTTATCCWTICTAPPSSIARRMQDMKPKWRPWPPSCIDAGRRPYVIPGGGSNPAGALGYVNAALELVNQANERGLRIDHMVHATGSAGTQAGLVAGLQALSSRIRLLGIGVRAPREKQEANGLRTGRGDLRNCWDCAGELPRERWWPTATTSARGYGMPTPASVEAVEAARAQLEGILLGPGVFGQRHGGPHRSDPQGTVQARARTSCSCIPAASSGCSAIPPPSGTRFADAAFRSERLRGG